MTSEPTVDTRRVAYFSMEIALDPAIPTYSGGLGILAGDTVRAAADAGLPMLAVTLLYRKGYFRQRLDKFGNQREEPVEWSPETLLESVPKAQVTLALEGRDVLVRAWRYVVHGVSGATVPVYLLDTAVAGNGPEDQALTDQLYGGDLRYRLCQEAVLGLAGIDMLNQLGYDGVTTYHMNEGHAALLTLALLEGQARARGAPVASIADEEAVRRHCVFTTHTPVPAGHDQFPLDLVRRVLGHERTRALEGGSGVSDEKLNMTYLALRFSRYVNGVAMRHGEVSQEMFPHFRINAITNGVHGTTWAAPAFAQLFDRHLPEWRHDNLYLRYAIGIPLEDIRQAHTVAKAELLREIAERTGVHLRPDVLTIGFARRATEYKRSDLMFTDLDRLRRIASQAGPIQVIYSGKAHPQDENGKAGIRRVFQAAAALAGSVPVVYLEEYDMALAQRLCAGIDLWLNTPRRPLEASGTSGMKAAINGVPSLSILDGWWIEGHAEGATGWAIGDESEPESDTPGEVASLYDKLERVIVPLFYGQPEAYAEVMRSAIALNGSFFNAQRMLYQYVTNAYGPQQGAS
jgi:starch phosphorylase